jgi:hypothetical protein
MKNKKLAIRHRLATHGLRAFFWFFFNQAHTQPALYAARVLYNIFNIICVYIYAHTRTQTHSTQHTTHTHNTQHTHTHTHTHTNTHYTLICKLIFFLKKRLIAEGAHASGAIKSSSKEDSSKLPKPVVKSQATRSDRGAYT